MTGSIVIAVVVFVAGAGILSYIISVYNGLIRAKNNVEKSFNNIDVLLQQRYDEIPNIVQAAKGYMKHERDLLADLVNLRMRYQQSRAMEQKIETENKLVDLMGRFNVLVEQYPDLKAIDAFTQLQVRISALESQIADRRELFNDSVNIYNIRMERFPDVIMARLLNYAAKSYLKVPEEKKKDLAMDLPV